MNDYDDGYHGDDDDQDPPPFMIGHEHPLLPPLLPSTTVAAARTKAKRTKSTSWLSSSYSSTASTCSMDSASIGERVSQRKRRSSLSSTVTNHNNHQDEEEEESPLHHFHGMCEDYHRVLDNTAVEYYDVIVPNVLNQAQFYVRQTTFPPRPQRRSSSSTALGRSPEPWTAPHDEPRTTEAAEFFAYTTFCEAPGQVNPSHACRVFRNPGDIIVAVNGIATADKTFDETCHLIQVAQEQSYMFLRMLDLRRYRHRRHQQQQQQALAQSKAQAQKKARGGRNLHQEQEDSWWEAPMKDFQKQPSTNKNPETDKIVAPHWKHPYAVDSTMGTRHLLQTDNNHNEDNDQNPPKNQLVETQQCLQRLQRHVHHKEQELELLREEYTLQQERLATLQKEQDERETQRARTMAAVSKNPRKRGTKRRSTSSTTTKRPDAPAPTKSKKRQASHKIQKPQTQEAVHPIDGRRRSARLLQQQQEQEQEQMTTAKTTWEEEDPANDDDDHEEENDGDCDLGNTRPQRRRRVTGSFGGHAGEHSSDSEEEEEEDDDVKGDEDYHDLEMDRGCTVVSAVTGPW